MKNFTIKQSICVVVRSTHAHCAVVRTVCREGAESYFIQCTVDTGEGVLIFLDLKLRVQAKNVDNVKLEKVEFDDFYIKKFSDNAISK